MLGLSDFLAFSHGSSVASSSTLEELQWTLDSRLENSIARAEKDAAELITLQVMSVVKTGHGKQVVKVAHVTVSPDAWGQLLVQLAHVRPLSSQGWQWQGGIYKSATAQQFFRLQGRTEAVCIVASESDAFTQAMFRQCWRKKAWIKLTIKPHSEARA